MAGRKFFPLRNKRVIKFFQFQPLLRRETRAPQADGVQSANPVVAARDGERRQIFADGRAALHDGQRADARELMHEAIAGNERAILHHRMAAEQRAVGDDDVVAQMRNCARRGSSPSENYSSR